MNVERLERLASLLERDAANETGVKFDLGTWASPGDSSKAWHDNSELPRVDCGTSACALGLAAISGEFEADGLTAIYEPFASASVDPVTGKPRAYHLYPAYKTHPEGYQYLGFDAGEHFFDITDDDAKYLFDPDCYANTILGADGEREVALRIREFAKGNIDTTQHPSYKDEDDYDNGD